MIDIVVITFNAKDKLKRCLRSIEKHTKNIRYCLTVVNNNSNDGTYQFLERYQRQNKVKIIYAHKNLGKCGAANIALKNTYNKFIAFLDDDAEVTKGWLLKLYSQIKNKSRVGMVGCKITFPNKRIFCADIRMIELSNLAGFGEMDRGQRDYMKEADGVAGTCRLIRRDLIKKIGYFNEKLSFSGQCEDIDWSVRARLADYKIIYNGKVKIIHHNLFRNGGIERYKKNYQIFLKKWGKVFHKFPLEDSHPIDKYIAVGLGYLKKNMFKQALIEFKKPESIDKIFSEPLYKAIALKGLKRFAEAIVEFKRILDLNPSNFWAHYHLATLYREMGKIRESRKYYLQSIESLTRYN